MARLAHASSVLTLARRYLAHRRKLGYALREAGRLLLGFGRHAERVAPGQPLTTAIALEWATSSPMAQRGTQAARLSTVRCFARYCAIRDPRTQIPDGHLLGPGNRRRRPHIFTRRQVSLMLRRARALTKRYSILHPMTYETLIGLLACTGIRAGEAWRLQREDFDAKAGVLRIGRCKSSPGRAIPLHPSTVRALQRYTQARLRLFPFGASLLVGVTGRPLHVSCVERTFRRLTAGITPRGDHRHLRLADFRHSFASGWIAEWSRQSKPVSHHLLLLARYLGHRNFRSTWWYISSDPKALQAAASSFLRFHEQGHP